jgi:hypothetical protein
VRLPGASLLFSRLFKSPCASGVETTPDVPLARCSAFPQRIGQN